MGHPRRDKSLPAGFQQVVSSVRQRSCQSRCDEKTVYRGAPSRKTKLGNPSLAEQKYPGDAANILDERY